MNNVSVAMEPSVVNTTVLAVSMPSWPYCTAIVYAEGVVAPASITKMATSCSFLNPRNMAIDTNTTGSTTIFTSAAVMDYLSADSAFLKLKSAPIHIRASGEAILAM